MDSSSKYLAMGGYQEIIKLFNLKKRVEAGELHEHKGTITALRFFKS